MGIYFSTFNFFYLSIILKATGGIFNSHFKLVELLLIPMCYVYPVGHYEFLSSLNIYKTFVSFEPCIVYITSSLLFLFFN